MANLGLVSILESMRLKERIGVGERVMFVLVSVPAVGLSKAHHATQHFDCLTINKDVYVFAAWNAPSDSFPSPRVDVRPVALCILLDELGHQTISGVGVCFVAHSQVVWIANRYASPFARGFDSSATVICGA